MEHRVVWWRWVGAAPVCPPVSPHRGASIVQSPHMICDFCMETPLRGRSGGHIGTAPTVSFSWIACGRLISFGVNCAWTEFCLCGIAWKNMMEMGRGGPVCPPVSPCKGASIVKSPRMICDFWYGNAATRTFGRAHRHRPYGFVWADCTRAVGVVGVDCV